MTAQDGLRRSSPEAQGVDSQAIEHFLEAVQAADIELHGLMLYRHGHVIAQGWWAPYRAELPHMQHSLVKSFAATGVGLAVDEGLLSLDDAVVSFFPEDLPEVVSDNLRAMTVRHLLTMTTGHATGISGGEWRTITTPWVREFFKEPVVESPGTTFVYSSASSYMLSAIVQKVSGQRLHDFMQPRFFEPLGITLDWDLCPHGINPGGNGITCTLSDLVKLGAVHVQGGLWEGQRILSQAWVQEATRAQLTNVKLGSFDGRRVSSGGADPNNTARTREGYGYQWWIGPHDTFYAGGLFGQYTLVFPQHDVVLAINSALRPRTETLLNLVWEHLLPAFGKKPLPEQPAALARLEKALAALTLLTPPARSDSPRVAQVSGVTYTMAPNEDSVASVSLTFQGDVCTFTQRDHRGVHTVRAGLGRAIEEPTSITGNKLHHQYQSQEERVSACGVWLDDDTFEMTWSLLETAFRDTVTCHFDDPGTLRLDRRVNVNSSGLERPTLVGQPA